MVDDDEMTVDEMPETPGLSPRVEAVLCRVFMGAMKAVAEADLDDGVRAAVMHELRRAYGKAERAIAWRALH